MVSFSLCGMARGIMGLSQEPQHGDSLLEWFDVEKR